MMAAAASSCAGAALSGEAAAPAAASVDAELEKVMAEDEEEQALGIADEPQLALVGEKSSALPVVAWCS